MAQVKCVYCSEKIEKSTSFKIPKTNKPNHYFYYCSSDEYELYQKIEEEKLAEREAEWIEKEEIKRKKKEESDQRQKLIDYIVYDFLDYQHGMAFPTFLTRQIKELKGDFYTYEMIEEAIRRGEDTVGWAMANKNFDNDFGKVRYIMTIAEGNINNVYKEWQMKEKALKQNEIRFSDVELMNDVDEPTLVKKKEKDSILSFLEEDEM